jgi:uncharacterized repeat protein (TIGR03803 family)
LSPANGSWTFTVLHQFTGKDGANPYASLLLDVAGNLYGTTWGGGNYRCNPTYGCGTAFKLAPGGGGQWTETVLHEFNGNNGAYPNANLIFDPAGDLYGTTASGGHSRGEGTVFKLTPGANDKWTETVLHIFYGSQ